MRNEIHHRNFGQLLSDAIFFEQLASNEISELKRKRFVRSSLFSIFLMFESAANCCLSCFEASNNLIRDIEKLPPLSKLDLFALHGFEKKIDYGRNEVQKVKEIKHIRDSIVHPKVTISKIGSPANDERNFVCFPYQATFSSKPKPATDIIENSSLWSHEDCLSALESMISFFNYFFSELLNMDNSLVFGILNDAIIIDGKPYSSIYPPTLFEEIEYLKTKDILVKFMATKP